MSKYEQDRVSKTLSVRFTPSIYKLVDRLSWTELKSSAQIVREAVIEALKRKGIEIPEPMNGFKEVEMLAEQRKAAEQGNNENTPAPLIPPTT